MIPGEWLLSEEPIEINAGRRTLRQSVRNIGDRPIQVGSHFQFYEVNRALEFDREAALGMRLDVPAGTKKVSIDVDLAEKDWQQHMNQDLRKAVDALGRRG